MNINQANTITKCFESGVMFGRHIEIFLRTTGDRCLAMRLLNQMQFRLWDGLGVMDEVLENGVLIP